MHFKIKCIPDDFVVEEIANLPFKEKGEYAVYILKKKEWNTIELIQEISHELKLPFKLFSFGGKKDKHAVSAQYITIKSPDIILLEKKKISLKFCGFMEQPMAPNLIEGNKFKVTLRDIAEENLENIQKEIEIVNSIGYANYFDDQRFGSFDQKQGFLAEEVLKRHFSEVLKIYLLSTCDPDKKDFFCKYWNDWNICRKKATTKFEKKIFDFLIKNPVYFLSMIKQIPKEGLSNHFSAYNGYIWNEVLRKILSIKISSGFKSYPGAIGDYVFYSQLEKEDFRYLEDLFIPTLPYKFRNEEVLVDKIYNQVMEIRGIKYSMFNKVKTRQVFFKSILRKAVVTPESLNFNMQDDDIYAGRRKLILSFILPRGSYGTMLVKRIFSFNNFI